MKVLSSLSSVYIWLFARTENNFFLWKNNFHCLHTLVSPSVTKGCFVFLLIVLTVFVPLPHCHETLTVKGHNCLHQRPALERVQIQLQHLENLFHMYQISVEHFSAASERHLSHLQVNWPRCHVSAVRAAQSLRWSRLSLPMKHDRDVGKVSLALSSIIFLTFPPQPSLTWPQGNRILYVNHLTFWPTIAVWLESIKIVSNTWDVTLKTTAF